MGLSRITRAYLLACNALRRYKKLMLGGMLADEALEHMEKGGCINRDKKRELTIAVLGYPYLIYDNFNFRTKKTPVSYTHLSLYIFR